MTFRWVESKKNDRTTVEYHSALELRQQIRFLLIRACSRRPDSRDHLQPKEMFYRSVKVQVWDSLLKLKLMSLTWSRSITGYFWIISIPEDIAPSMVSSLDPLPQSLSPSSSSSPPSPLAWRHIAEQEAERLAKQNREAVSCWMAGKDKDDTTPWFLRNRWYLLFVGKDLRVGPPSFICFNSLTEACQLHSVAVVS